MIGEKSPLRSKSGFAAQSVEWPDLNNYLLARDGGYNLARK
jgi:hypothetical protein